MFIGIFSRKATKRSGLTALVTGIVVGTVVFLFAQIHPEYGYLTKMAQMTTITFVATVVGAIAGTLFFKDSPEEKAEVAAFFKKRHPVWNKFTLAFSHFAFAILSADCLYSLQKGGMSMRHIFCTCVLRFALWLRGYGVRSSRRTRVRRSRQRVPPT